MLGKMVIQLSCFLGLSVWMNDTMLSAVTVMFSSGTSSGIVMAGTNGGNVGQDQFSVGIQGEVACPGVRESVHAQTVFNLDREEAALDREIKGASVGSMPPCRKSSCVPDTLVPRPTNTPVGPMSPFTFSVPGCSRS